MCGLLASTGKIEGRYVTALGCLSEKRGDDSAGVAWSVQGNVRVAKVAQSPLVAFPVSLAPAIRHASRYSSVLIGHTRQATTGGVTQKNAHPFYDPESNISWAHNGVISNYGSFGNYEVDSECLIHGIVKEDFSAFWGPIALVWIEQGKLHAFRKGNPLYRGTRNRAVYLASEQEMLEGIGCKRIKSLSEGFIYRWDGMTLSETKKIPYNKMRVAKYAPTADYDYPPLCGSGRITYPSTVTKEKTHRCHGKACQEKRGGEVPLEPMELCLQCQVRIPTYPMTLCRECYMRDGRYGSMEY